MPADFISNLYVFILAGFVGFEVIKRVSPLLHTPLMSLTNALDAIVVVAAIIIAGRHETVLSTTLGADRGGRFVQQHGRRLLHHRPHAAHVQDGQAQKVTSHRASSSSSISLSSPQSRFSFWRCEWLSSPVTARRGVLAGEIAAALAVGATLLNPEVVQYKWIVIALIVGAGIGIPLGMVQMTAVPQRTALSHAFGALSAALIGIAEYYVGVPHVTRFEMGEIGLEVIIGSLTFTGSLIAAGKLQEILPQRPITYQGQNFVSLSVLGAALLIAIALTIDPNHHAFLFPAMVGVALIFGIMLVTPIGGADMPTVISLLNSYAGFSAALLGFVLNSKVLIVAGALDGSSGFILSVIMCKAMNRSFTNVMFGAFGQVQASAQPSPRGEPCAAPRQKRLPRFWPPRAKWSSFLATAWPWRRRSTKSASCTTS